MARKQSFQKTIFDAKEAIIYDKVDEAVAIISKHIDDEHGIDSDLSKLNMNIHSHRVFLERAIKFLDAYKKTKDVSYKRKAEADLDSAETTTLEIYDYMDKLRKDLLQEE